MKTLSDGTIAKVGMVVVVIDGTCGGNEAGQTTEIVDLATTYDIGHAVRCKNVDPNPTYSEQMWWNEYCADLRMATPLERDAYYTGK